ncbi:hypothetical protein ABZ819_14850 [Streptomyces venezuelae]|uniref:hypothetical protein n=1 Tax=Streptomyces venezuelae TaxID=54571 RepID=UPI00343B27BC
MSTPEPGQEVQVPWGLDVLRGTVLRTYDTGRGAQAVVRVEVPGVSGTSIDEVTVTLPVGSLQAPPEIGAPAPVVGNWVHAMGYERDFYYHLESILNSLTPEGSTYVQRAELDGGHDFYVGRNLGKGQEGEILLYGVLKYSPTKTPLSAKRLQSAISWGESMNHANGRLLIVTNVDISAAAMRFLSESDSQLLWLKWRGPEDDSKLRDLAMNLI